MSYYSPMSDFEFSLTQDSTIYVLLKNTLYVSIDISHSFTERHTLPKSSTRTKLAVGAYNGMWQLFGP